MEEGKKKIVMIVIIVACLVAAGIITYTTRFGSMGTAPRAITIQLKCSNPDCGHEWQMDMEDYTAYVREHEGPTRERPAIACPKCGKKSGFPVEK
jgi:flagellar basal body-associated protein FliL